MLVTEMGIDMEKELEIEGGKLCYQVCGDEITVKSCQVHNSKVKLPDKIEDLSVTKLHKKAFLSSKLLKEVWLPKGLKEIGDWAFAYCSALESVWVPGEEFTIGKDIFKDCNQLSRICRLGADGLMEEQVGRLLGVVPVRLEADYLFTPAQAGDEQWLKRFDDKLKEFLALPDEDGFTKMVYCGEEDIVANVEYYLAERRREKARLCFLRLINHVGLDEKFAGELSAYLAGKTKGCPSEAAWEVVFGEHGNEQAYYDVFTKSGCLTEENYDVLLQQMGENYPEMKGYLMRYKSQEMEKADFFDALSL
ncbi:leucine-rich repeat domain-containing protein [Parablautia muri]|uniref:leucine-rich repeat domain-containing protein n=1 Tax=Parablautia muri TaxID=2320879 RepID=UPI002ED42F84